MRIVLDDDDVLDAFKLWADKHHPEWAGKHLDVIFETSPSSVRVMLVEQPHEFTNMNTL